MGDPLKNKDIQKMRKLVEGILKIPPNTKFQRIRTNGSKVIHGTSFVQGAFAQAKYQNCNEFIMARQI